MKKTIPSIDTIKGGVFILLVLLGFIAMVWGFANLQRIFQDERDQAHAALENRQNTLQEFALETLGKLLRQQMQLAWPKMQVLLNDPLKNSNQYFYAVDGQQRLPKLIGFRPTQSQAHIQKYQYWLTASPVQLRTNLFDPWSVRSDSFAEFILALQNKDHERIRDGFREIRRLHAENNVDSAEDIVWLLAAMQRFSRDSVPNYTRWQGLLRGGSVEDMEMNRPGLQRQFLAARAQFTQTEFEFLSPLIIKFSLLADVPVDDFVDRIVEDSERLAFVGIDRMTLFQNGSWYVEPYAQNGTRAVRISLYELEQQLHAELVLLSLLSLDDQIHIQIGQSSPLDSLKIQIQLKDAKLREYEIKERYRIKISMLYLMALAILIIVSLVVQMQRRTQRSLTLKADFLAAMTHELRTPLASMRLLAETIYRKLTFDEKVKDYPQRIIQGVDQMNELVDNILAYNRLNQSTWDLKLDCTDKNEFIESLRLEIRRRQENFVIRLIIADEADFQILVDRQLLQILLSNLVSNACKYCDKSEVELRLCWTQSSIVFADNACGVQRSLWEKVFEDFFRVENHLVKTHGTGLGLAICRRIMSLHQGSIRILESDHHGSRWQLRFRHCLQTTKLLEPLE